MTAGLPLSPVLPFEKNTMFELVYPDGDYAPRIPRPSAAASELMLSGNLDTQDETFPVVEESGLVVGMASRAYCHASTMLLHPVVHLHIIDRFGRVCLQKRSTSKFIQPGRWDTSVGGHVNYGESIMEALFRESSEELGFIHYNPIHMGNYVWESDIERELVSVFAAVGNFKLHPDGNEIDEIRYWTPEEIEGAPADKFTPMFLSEFKDLKDRLLALL